MTGKQTLSAGAEVSTGAWNTLVASRPVRALGGVLIGAGLGGCGVSEVEGNAIAGTAEAEASREFSVVYYQPRLQDLHDTQSTEVPNGPYTMVAEPDQPNAWAVGNCQPGNADNFREQGHADANTLMGFSLGRLGPIYFLQGATEAERDAISTISIVAPGNIEDLTDSCDPPDTDRILDVWLAEDPDNRLTIVTDQRTTENGHAVLDRYLYAARGAVKNQVEVCDTGLGHEEAWNTVKDDLVADPTTCPPGTTAYHAWR